MHSYYKKYKRGFYVTFVCEICIMLIFRCKLLISKKYRYIRGVLTNIQSLLSMSKTFFIFVRSIDILLPSLFKCNIIFISIYNSNYECPTILFGRITKYKIIQISKHDIKLSQTSF